MSHMEMNGQEVQELSPENLHVVPLGGVMEIGKNMTAYVYGDKILVVDAGLMFPEEEMLGVDIVIPDITFLEENKSKIVGIVLTHGHEDHIGALPYVLKRLDVPVYGAPLTIGFVSGKLEEHKMLEDVNLNVVEPGDRFQLGDFDIEYVRVAHSIPDAAGIVIRTPVGNVVHTSDFKFDQSPVDGQGADIGRFARVGEEGVLLFMCDSTNVEKDGFTQSESLVGESFDKIFASAEGRVIVAAFASNLHRIQQVYNAASKYGRKVIVLGRSMEQNCRIAEELGYLVVPEEVRLQSNELEHTPPDEIVIMTTGSQGEPLSALSRMATDIHKQIKLSEGDTVIISATPIPGNEDLVLRTVNRLFKLGADVIYEPFHKVHVSGHGNKEDIRLMVNLLHPKYVVPVHGEQRHYARFVELADTMGYEKSEVFRMTPGDILCFDPDGNAEIIGKVESGRVMVDGLGVGDVEDVVLRDRLHLAQDGVLIIVAGIDVHTGEIVTGPDIMSRGFAGEELEDEIVDEAREIVSKRIGEIVEQDSFDDIEDIRNGCRKALAKFLYDRTGRRPVVVPIIMEM